jgi:FixJ family two-component response regulator
MPGITGTDLARDLLARFPQCAALIVSGYAEVDGIAPDLPRLSKPFRLQELAGALAELKVLED